MSNRVKGHLQLPDAAEKFKVVEDALTIRRYLSQAFESAGRAQFQIKDSEKKFESHVDSSSGPRNGILLKQGGVSLEDFESEIKKMGSDFFQIVLYLEGQLLIGFKVKYVGHKNSRFEFEYPSQIVRIQRRKSLRLNILAGYDLSVQIDAIEGEARRVRKKLLDISAEGLGFHVQSPREAERFKKGLIMKNIRMSIQGREIILDAQVCSHVSLKENVKLGGIKVGVKFLRARPEDVEFISSYVLENMAYVIF